MQTSSKGLAFIKAHEGLRLEAYPDPALGWSLPTIGYGHTSAAGPPDVARGMSITATDAGRILKDDLARSFEPAVNRRVTVPLSQPQFDALVSFAFNLGTGNLSRSTLLKKLNGGEYDGAAAEFARWVFAGGRKLPGLVTRRAAEAALFRSAMPGQGARPPSQQPGIPAPGGNARPPWWVFAFFIAAVAAVVAVKIIT